MPEKSLYEQLSDRIFTTGSKIIPKLFAMIADEVDAKLLLSMPGSAEELANKLRLAEVETQKRAEEMYHKGLAFKSVKGTDVKYRMCRDLMQFHDATILWPEAPRNFHDMWQQYMEQEWPGYASFAEKLLPQPMIRVVPVHENINATNKVLPYEDAIAIIDNAEKIAVTKCTCRVIAHKCDNPVEVCLQIGKGAAYAIDRGSGRQVTKDEAKKIIKECEESGLIHTTMNKTSMDHFICNCCRCCCQMMPVMIQYGTKLLSPSRFTAAIDKDNCTGCGLCIERCFFSAITLNDTAEIDPVKCIGCGLCAVVCPVEAISLKETKPQDFIPE